MAGFFYAPPPSQIGGSQPYAPRLGIVQSGPTPQAPPLRGPLALATLAVLSAAWTPPYVRAQSSATIAPLIPAAVASNPPPFIQQRHIVGSWSQDTVTVIYLTQVAANNIGADPPPAKSYVNANTIRAAWNPPWIPPQGYADSAPLLPAPVAPSAPPVITHVNDRTIVQSWVPPWYGPPRPLSTSALPAAPVASAPPVLTRINDRTVLQAWVAPWIAPPRLLGTDAFPPPSAPPPKTYAVLHSIVGQWTTPLPTQKVYGVAALLPAVVTPDVIYEIVPYLIGQFEDSARFMLTQVYLVPSVVGSGGVVQAQSIDLGTLVPRGTTVTITMGGTPNNGRRNRSRGQPPYNSGIV